jgi:hypothetical protein
VVEIELDSEVDKRRETFLRLLFGTHEGDYFCIAYAPRNMDRKKFREEWFQYPNDIPQAIDLIGRITVGHNVWYCPHLFNKRKRIKENVVFTPCAWSDLDTCEPEALFVQPTISIESSGTVDVRQGGRP